MAAADGTLGWVRSVLFVGGHALPALDTPAARSADLWVLDLEDMVPPEAKGDALAAVARLLPTLDASRRRRTYVRSSVNPPPAPEMALALAAAGIVLPKVEGIEDVAPVIELLRDRAGRSPAARVIVTIETPRAVLHAEELLAADPIVAAAVFGPSDLSLALGISRDDRAGLQYPRSHVAVCAAAAGVLAIDGGYLKPDEPGLTIDAAGGRDLGYAAKLTTFAEHVPVINRLMGPSPDELAWANQVLAAADQGRVEMGPGMADPVTVARARHIVRRAGEGSDVPAEEAVTRGS